MPAAYHVKRRLTSESSMFPHRFDPIGPWFFPEKGTDFLSDQFATHSKANLLGLRDAKPVGDDDLPSTVEVVYDPDKSFTIPVYSLSNPEKWITQRNADPGLSYPLARSITLTLAMRIMLEYIRVNKRLRDTTQMTQNRTLVLAEQFDNLNSGSNQPVVLLKGYATLLKNQNQGRPPNRASCADEVLNAIADTQDFRTRVQYTTIPNAEDMQKQPNGIARLLEQMIGLPAGTIRPHNATYNAGTIANPSYKKFIGSDFLMTYVEDLGLMSWTHAVGWKWNAVPSETAITTKPQLTRGAPIGEEYIVIAATEPQIVRPELGVVIKNCVNVNAPANAFLD